LSENTHLKIPKLYASDVWHSSIARRIGVLLFVGSVGSLLAFFLFLSFHAHLDAGVINVAGSQRMRAAEIADWVNMVASGQEEDRAGLRQRVAEFTEVLKVLEQGGEIGGDEIPPPPPGAVGDAAAGVRSSWDDLEPRLLIIAERPVASPEFEHAARDIRPALKTLATKANQLTAAELELRRSAWVRVLQFLGNEGGQFPLQQLCNTARTAEFLRHV